MRKRTENRIRKAVRIASQAEPSFARRCVQLEHASRTLESALVVITTDRQAAVAERMMAAELLMLAGHCPDPYRPLFDHFLDCDGTTAWSLTTAFSSADYRPTAQDERKLGWILRNDSEEERRAATAQFLARCKGAGIERMLIETLENHKETSYVRGRAAEALTIRHCSPEAFQACIRCLNDPDPGVRFWAVFALGCMAQFRPRLQAIAIPALWAMVSDTGAHAGYWTVDCEARATIEQMVPAQFDVGEQERSAILSDPAAPADLRRWAEYDSRTSNGRDQSGSYIKARYKNLRWLRFRRDNVNK